MVTPNDYPDFPFLPRWISLDTGRMHYVDEGRGPSTLVLVHGTPTWSYEWRHVIRTLSMRYRVIALDHLGFGFSDRPPTGTYTPEWHAANFAQFIERLAPGPFTLVVHDFGGPIALGLAEQRPDLVQRIVVVNSWMWSFADDRGMRWRGQIAGSWLGRFLYRWANLSLRVIMPSAYGDRSKLTPAIQQAYADRFPDRGSRGTVLWALARALNRSSEFYERLWRDRELLADRPMLIVWGVRDSAFQPYVLDRWVAAYPHARTHRILEAGHWPHEEAPDEVTAAIAAFVG
jgi:haloalkane dehalogenase